MTLSGRTVISVFFFLFIFFSGSVVRTLAIIHPTEFLALQSIRKSLSDLPGSTFFSSWDFTCDPCNNFSGVLCSSDRIISLTLGDPTASSPGLSGHLSPALFRLSNLSSLSLVPGRVSGPLPQTLPQSLRFLAISRNFLSGDIPASISALRLLRTLDLSYNQLAGPIPRQLGEIQTLTNLILCQNHLSGDIPPLISPALTRLDLMHNNLSGGLSPPSLPPSLQYLSLSSNQLTGSVDSVLTRLDRLSYLDLSMNRFTGSIPGSVFSFPISTLLLQRNLFSGPVRPLDKVRIQTVDLSYNRLDGEISPLFSTVENLYLNNNGFSGQVPGSFVDRVMDAGFRVLYLQHNYLTGIGIDPTAVIPLSCSLCLQYNCMVLPVQTACPVRAGKMKTRPTAQCSHWRGKARVAGGKIGN
ncbi:hypothetical protein MRB53_028117 [Persea americana]|uniref:Uncharacterized protein n=1 Tax=Persea americana TaxID=3435 RepID=A0ACC2KFA4_PERAE|nr:hypothetical protein MRB53_028117 [Persea americana]